MGRLDDLQDSVVEAGDRFAARVDELKSFLAFASTSAAGDSTWASSSRDARALALICTAAELEALVKAVVQGFNRAVNDIRVPISKLTPSIRQLAAHTTFESLRTVQDHSKLWTHRDFATTLDKCNEFASLPIEERTAQPPLDGRTLKPEHFYRIWVIYSLPGEAFPNVAWTGSLMKLASARNDLAHANLPYMEIFQQAGRGANDVEKYVEDVSAFAEHFVLTWCEYVDGGQFLLT